MKYRTLDTKFLFLCLLFLSAFGERILFDFGPNVELVTTAMILASFYYGKKESFWLTFAIIVFSDLVIGNSNIFIFTWSGFLIPALVVGGIFKKITTYNLQPTTKKIFDVFSLTTLGISSNIFFYLWTNLGVWLLSNMYPKTAAGLLMSYLNALPFLRYQLTSTLVFVPLGFFLTQITIHLSKNYQARVRVQGTLV